jgi:hypothetical protein
MRLTLPSLGFVFVVLLCITPAFEAVHASDACFSTHVSGSGANRMDICISSHGNLVQFTSPTEHIRVGTIGEGYAVCSNNGAVVHGYDAAFTEGPWLGDPTIDQPNGPNTFPLTITRTTIDGVFSVKQKFAMDAKEKDVTITMTLKNISAATVPTVEVSRYVDADVDEDSTPRSVGRLTDSVWFTANDPSPMTYGLSLIAGTLATGHTTRIENEPDFIGTTHAGCDPSTNPTVGPGYSGRITYQLGDFTKGKSKTITYVYRRY